MLSRMRKNADMDSEWEAKRQRRNSTDGESTAGLSSADIDRKDVKKEETEGSCGQVNECDKTKREASPFLSYTIVENPSSSDPDLMHYIGDLSEIRRPPPNTFGVGPRVNHRLLFGARPAEISAEREQTIQRAQTIHKFIERNREVNKYVDPFTSFCEIVKKKTEATGNSTWKKLLRGAGEESINIEEFIAASKACGTTIREQLIKENLICDPFDDLLADEMREGGLLEGVPVEKVFKRHSGPSPLDAFPVKSFYDEKRKEKKERENKLIKLGMSPEELAPKEMSAKRREEMMVREEPQFLCSEDLTYSEANKMPQSPLIDTDVLPSDDVRECKSPANIDFESLLTQEEPLYNSVLQDWNIYDSINNSAEFPPIF